MIPRKIVLRQTEQGWLLAKETPHGYRTIEGPYRRHEYALSRFDLITGQRTMKPTNQQFKPRVW